VAEGRVVEVFSEECAELGSCINGTLGGRGDESVVVAEVVGVSALGWPTVNIAVGWATVIIAVGWDTDNMASSDSEEEEVAAGIDMGTVDGVSKGAGRRVGIEGCRGRCWEDICALVISWFICSNSADRADGGVGSTVSTSIAPDEILEVGLCVGVCIGDISSSRSSTSIPASDTASITGARC